MAPRHQDLISCSDAISIPLEHPPEGVMSVLVVLLRLDLLSGIEAQQVMEPVPAGDGGGFEQVRIRQMLQQRLGFLETAVSKDGGHAGSEVGTGDEAEAAKHPGCRRIQVPVAEGEARPHLQILDPELLQAGALVSEASCPPGEAPGGPGSEAVAG